MREIRFRAWGHQESDSVYRMFYGVALNSWIIPIWEDTPICDHKLMQFTGLKDKKETDIYEGDIVKMFALSGNKIIIGKVKIESTRGVVVDCWPFSFQESTEVIGNIYENKELLK